MIYVDMQYEVTIGIPVYNVEKYIRRAMDSALAQTFSDIEFLVCDDGSQDSSIAIVEEYQRNHPRGKDIRIVHQPRNMGAGNTRNRIVKETRTHYLYQLDADDAIAPQTIELLYNAVQKYNADIAFGSFERIIEYGEEKKKEIIRYPSMQFLKENEFASWVYRKYDGIQAMTWNFLINIDIYRKNNLQYEPVNFWEDFTFTIDLPTYVSRAVLLPEVTYSYYCREGTLSNYQKRSHINKVEIQKTINAIVAVKNRSERVKEKPYFSCRMCKVMMTCFFLARHIVIRNDNIQPPFSKKEIRGIMTSPISLFNILSSKKCWVKNVCLYLLGILPPSLSVWLIKLSNRR